MYNKQQQYWQNDQIPSNDWLVRVLSWELRGPSQVPRMCRRLGLGWSYVLLNEK